jgi:hypothetical protein
VQIRLTRDDVAAGDEPEKRVVDVEDRAPLAQFLTSAGRTFLPNIYGGRATWLIRRGRRGRVVAVYAQEWGRAEMVRMATDYIASTETLHFDYRAQTDPKAALERLRRRA